MKKRVFILLLTTIMVVLASAIRLYAAESGSVSVSASGSCKAGETVTLTVKLSGAADVNGIAVTPTFDSDIFELTDGTWKVSGIISDFSVESGDGVIAFAEGTDLNTSILTFTLKVRSNVEAGKYTAGCSAVVSTTDGKSVTLTASTSVNVTCTHSFTVKDSSAKYRKSAATCSSPAVYYYSCAKCGEKGTSTFQSGDTLEHTFDQKNTSSKFICTSGNCTTAAVYYYSCKCGVKGTETFVGADPSHDYATEWKTDADSHWHECTACGDKIDTATHTPGEAATEEKAQVCTVCGYVITPALVHLHDYTVHWYGDADQHWGECVCGEQSPVAKHVWNSGETVKVPTVDEEGIVLYTCGDCGRMKIKAIAPDSSVSGSDDSDDTEKPGDDTDVPAVTDDHSSENEPDLVEPAGDEQDDGGSFGMGILTGALIGLLVGGTVVLIALPKLKKTK